MIVDTKVEPISIAAYRITSNLFNFIILRIMITGNFMTRDINTQGKYAAQIVTPIIGYQKKKRIACRSITKLIRSKL